MSFQSQPRLSDPDDEKVVEAAVRLAKEDGVSLNQWIAVAIAQKIGVVETASGFLARRAGKAWPDDILPILNKARRDAPQAGDEI